MQGTATTVNDYPGLSIIRVWSQITGGYHVELWIDGSIWCDEIAEDGQSAFWYAYDLLTYYFDIPPGVSSALDARIALSSDAATLRWREDVERYEYLHIPKYPLRYPMMDGAHPYPRAVRQ